MKTINKREWKEVINKINLKRVGFHEAVQAGEEDVAREYYLEIRAEFEMAISIIPVWSLVFKRKAVVYFNTAMAEMEQSFEEKYDKFLP